MIKKRIKSLIYALGIFCLLVLPDFSVIAKPLTSDDFSYIMSSTAIHVPLNKFILLRQGDKVGAFRFTHYEEKKAEYEWFYPLSSEKGKTEIKTGVGSVKDHYVTLIGRLSFQLGQMEIKCGDLRVLWTTLNIVCFYNDSDKYPENSSVELAPTNKGNISEIDLSNLKLKWYKYDDHRTDFKIQLDEL